MKENKRFLRVSEVARLFNVHPHTIRYWHKKGWIRAFRFSRSANRRFLIDDVLFWLKKHTL